MKQRFVFLGIALILLFGMTAGAASYNVQETETGEKKNITLTYEETKEGKVEEEDIAKTLEYDGKEYRLISADIEYTFEESECTPVDTITRRIALSSDEIANIPRYIKSGDIMYVLNEGSVDIRATEFDTTQGADAVTLSKTITDLPDNDLERIPMTVKKNGIEYELLHVDYTVNDIDEQGVPTGYTAVCRYGALKNYDVSYEAGWEAIVTYTGYKAEYISFSTIQYVYESVEPIEEIQIDIPRETEEPEKHTNIAAAAASTAGGILFVALAGIFFLTVPVYAVLGNGDYQYIGRMRLKKRKQQYEGTLKKSFLEKAESGDFMVKIPKRVQKRSNMGVFNIKCPDGTVLRKAMQDKIFFSFYPK